MVSRIFQCPNIVLPARPIKPIKCCIAFLPYRSDFVKKVKKMPYCTVDYFWGRGPRRRGAGAGAAAGRDELDEGSLGRQSLFFCVGRVSVSRRRVVVAAGLYKNDG